MRRSWSCSFDSAAEKVVDVGRGVMWWSFAVVVKTGDVLGVLMEEEKGWDGIGRHTGHGSLSR
jgi:hypothetical protein